MNIVQLTPGTGNFHCGSCLRDHALVRGLRARGHDALLVPLYLPHVVDESAADARTPVFLSGISVHLDQHYPALRHRPAWLDRLLSAPRLLGLCAHLAGLTSAATLGASTVALLQPGGGAQARELQRLIAWLRGQPRPDLIVLSNVLLAGLARPLRDQLGVPVISTLQGEDSFLDGLPAPHRAQAWELLAARCREVDHFVAISRYFGDLMARRLALPAERISVVYPGVVMDDFAAPPQPESPPVIGYLARLTAAKGLGVLVDAFIELKRRDRIPGLRLSVAGAQAGRDEAYASELQTRLAAAGLASSVAFRPNLDRTQKLDFLRGLSVLSVPATYGEAFGLYVLEALAAGVPVVQPRHGAFPEVLDQTGGGVLCAPDDPIALADALEQVLLDPAQAQRLGAAGRRVVRDRFSAAAMAAQAEAVYADVVRRNA